MVTSAAQGLATLSLGICPLLSPPSTHLRLLQPPVSSTGASMALGALTSWRTALSG